MPQDLEERLNVEYMTGAQNPDMDMYRIPLAAAKQMLPYDEASVYRLLPSGPEKIAPIAETDRIIGKSPALHKPEKDRSSQER